MIYFKKILRYALPYKRFAFLNIFFNILYAVFSALSFVVLMPLFEVIFKTDEKIVYEKPVFEGFTSGMEYLNNYFNYYVSTIIGENQEKTLLFIVVLIVVIFLLKNMFGYLSFYYITFLKNGVLKEFVTIYITKLFLYQFPIFLKRRKEILWPELGQMLLKFIILFYQF